MTLPDAYAQSVRECTRGGIWCGGAAMTVGTVSVLLGYGFASGVLMLVAMILLLCAGGLLFAAALGGAP